MRKIREQKGLTLKQLSNGVLSVSFLSKFERGESDISLSHIALLLERLSLTFEEFFYIHHDFELDHLERFFDEADQAYSHRNLLKIEQLKKGEIEKWNKTGIETYLCNALMLGVYENIISGKDISGEKEELEVYMTIYLK